MEMCWFYMGSAQIAFAWTAFAIPAMFFSGPTQLCDYAQPTRAFHRQISGSCLIVHLIFLAKYRGVLRLLGCLKIIDQYKTWLV